MNYGSVRTAALAFTLLSTVSAGAATSSRCHMEVLSSEELPYALVGDWLLKATVRITYPHGPSAISTFVKSAPWQTTLRRGDNFSFDCERLKDLWTTSLTPTR
ncbi:hypothetical protein [Bradyrhizobium betae]|uniref:Uncharacterized protein n=1 Tax=Bradyrhizobium betae TaxID=244734 RepID=A0A5P6P8Y9_9BRAD|nr:hypothetical protein [Bradyrhizobium betae]MCS3727229.1 hypothetical protein [Bradyrhizobium betae]QFI74857.1 hypothetical protein F8237_22100 [Bradyrhizobium betae]